MSGFAKRKDENHAEVVAELKESFPEASVEDLAHAGKGVSDIVVGVFGDNHFFEIKDPAKPPSRRKLTNAQLAFHANWQGSIWVCHSAAEILACLVRFYAKKGARA